MLPGDDFTGVTSHFAMQFLYKLRNNFNCNAIYPCLQTYAQCKLHEASAYEDMPNQKVSLQTDACAMLHL